MVEKKCQLFLGGYKKMQARGEEWEKGALMEDSTSEINVTWALKTWADWETSSVAKLHSFENR